MAFDRQIGNTLHKMIVKFKVDCNIIIHILQLRDLSSLDIMVCINGLPQDCCNCSALAMQLL